ncbi:MAG TPA: hypothetical protein VHO01_15495 [Jatrophihabitans sp.]|nr:hypothetical protein [Jatrophihabitans sp.]
MGPSRLSAQNTATRRRRRRQPAQRHPSAGLYLKSIDTSVDVCRMMDDPAIALLVTEDTCWQLAVELHRQRRPDWYRLGERRRWAAENAGLREKQRRIRTMALEAGVRLPRR